MKSEKTSLSTMRWARIFLGTFLGCAVLAASPAMAYDIKAVWVGILHSEPGLCITARLSTGVNSDGTIGNGFNAFLWAECPPTLDERAQGQADSIRLYGQSALFAYYYDDATGAHINCGFSGFTQWLNTSHQSAYQDSIATCPHNHWVEAVGIVQVITPRSWLPYAYSWESGWFYYE
jgi:hypothetical protein